jgi:hypothetical protein
MNIWPYGFGQLSLLVKRCENHMATSLGCIQILGATPAAWSKAVGYTGMGIVVKQDDAICDFIMKFFLIEVRSF